MCPVDMLCCSDYSGLAADISATYFGTSLSLEVHLPFVSSSSQSPESIASVVRQLFSPLPSVFNQFRGLCQA